MTAKQFKIFMDKLLPIRFKLGFNFTFASIVCHLKHARLSKMLDNVWCFSLFKQRSNFQKSRNIYMNTCTSTLLGFSPCSTQMS